MTLTSTPIQYAHLQRAWERERDDVARGVRK
jgi:hypothetical protein